MSLCKELYVLSPGNSWTAAPLKSAPSGQRPLKGLKSGLFSILISLALVN
jgi:hypothetical protein